MAINPTLDRSNLDKLGGSSSDKQRVGILLVSVLMAFVMYLHRLTLSEIVKYQNFQEAFGASRQDLGSVLGAFFFTYALFQIPASRLSDHFGGRLMLTSYILVWSILTGLTGLVSSITALLIVRLACGVAQAGAYPTSSAMVRRWIPLSSRGLASGMISMGGRIGGAVSAMLTAWLIVQTGSWRTTLLVLCVLGILTAISYWIIVRDQPEETPSKERPPDRNQQDGKQTVGLSSLRMQLAEIPQLLLACCRSRGLCLAAFVQFSVNIGWVFLATWLPTYLTQAKKVDEVDGARLVTFVLACGIPAQLLGGVLSDLSVKKFGLRWGRVLPVSSAALVACMAYSTCIGVDSVFAIIVCCATVSVMTDLANPSFWAFTQDVGGQNTATALGWCNMWGNFGASLSAAMVPKLLKLGETNGWGTAPMFVVFGCSFLACSIAALGMNATVPVQFSSRS